MFVSSLSVCPSCVILITSLSLYTTLSDDHIMLVYTICRRGILSQLAVGKLRDLGFVNVVHIEGGLEGWSAIDESFPMY
jgi:rhodanese-related sulfurtransferase